MLGAAAVVGLVAATAKRRPVAELYPKGDLYPSNVPGAFLWARKVSPLVRRIFDRAYLSPEPVESDAAGTSYETPEGERYWTVVAQDAPFFSASKTVSVVLDDGGDATVCTTPDLGRVRFTRTAFAKPGWVLLAHASDRGAF